MFNRVFKDCSPDLADRIVSQSYQVKQKLSLYGSICSFFGELYLPRPEFVMPVAFALGFFLSFTISPFVELTDFVDSLYLQF